ncbi:GNAT family N-acetyltransferase [Intrasporangium sp.]|uniref:GNAT family N-acetyltransferase n=1 Tax=Intrasporangium sp. TaxID=1925024 RepID=UPI00293991D0|nr:GNAT family N-acetyltransferase [Intrasporangium sp.]MDV3220371.1 GNAT family N-acetyltransferase [Intrasporangium sp.]
MSSPTTLTPTLTDGTITLRRHTLADVDGIVEQATDEMSQRWTMVPRGYTRQDAVGFVEQIASEWADPRGKRFWAIEVTGVDGRPRFGGTVDLRPGEAWDHASIGFGLHPAARGQGAMSRAVRLVATHAFEQGPWGRPLNRIHWRAIAGNWGSRRVAWATGFTFHGTLPGTHPNVRDPQGPSLDSWHASLAAGEAMHPRLPWFEAPLLEDGAIRLRAWRESDVAALEERNDPTHWFPPQALLSADTFDAWLARRHELMASGSAIEWAIADGATDRALGHMTVFVRGGTLTGDVAEVGYQLVPSARGRGAAKAACRLAIAYAFATKQDGGLGLRRLTAGTAADNAASNAVLRAVGFTEVGREHATDELPDGTFGDGLIWELLR